VTSGPGTLANVAFNLNHPVLSNRFVRQAIAHAIDYAHITDVINPDAGLGDCPADCLPIWPMLEWAWPTDDDRDRLNLWPYVTDIAIANQYMDMYRYSLVDTDYTLGPIGDGDFSGYVEPLDFTVWATRIVKGQLLPYEWPWSPGRDIDPDWDNNAYVDVSDFIRYRDDRDIYYPFQGAR
jgi:ABC-type transport system substrate-binding protein